MRLILGFATAAPATFLNLDNVSREDIEQLDASDSARTRRIAFQCYLHYEPSLYVVAESSSSIQGEVDVLRSQSVTMIKIEYARDE